MQNTYLMEHLSLQHRETFHNSITRQTSNHRRRGKDPNRYFTK